MKHEQPIQTLGDLCELLCSTGPLRDVAVYLSLSKKGFRTAVVHKKEQSYVIRKHLDHSLAQALVPKLDQGSHQQ